MKPFLEISIAGELVDPWASSWLHLRISFTNPLSQGTIKPITLVSGGYIDV